MPLSESNVTLRHGFIRFCSAGDQINKPMALQILGADPFKRVSLVEILMIKTVAAALALATLSATPALADISKKFGRASVDTVRGTNADLLPPSGYKSQWWVAPNNCEYSRSGRPGEVVWFLIINNAHSKCDRYLVQRGFKDAY